MLGREVDSYTKSVWVRAFLCSDGYQRLETEKQVSTCFHSGPREVALLDLFNTDHSGLSETMRSSAERKLEQGRGLWQPSHKVWVSTMWWDGGCYGIKAIVMSSPLSEVQWDTGTKAQVLCLLQCRKVSVGTTAIVALVTGISEWDFFLALMLWFQTQLEPL